MIKQKKVAIIGGGFSGLAVAYNLLQQDNKKNSVEIDIFDEENFQNNGKAYQTQDLSHILNVPADKMGLPFDKADDFYLWLKNRQNSEILRQNSDQISKEYFAPRKLYNLYLQEIIAKLKQNSCLNFINQKVVSIKKNNNCYVLTADNGEFAQYDYVVLACGLGVKNLPFVENSNKIINNVWKFFNQNIKADNGTILIVGTGLTMVDVVLGLKNKGFNGKIIACSKSGKLPLPHSKDRTTAFETINIADAKLPLSKILSKLKKAAKTSQNWQSVIHGLRPITSKFWQEMSLAKKQQFIRHLNNFWNIHRHRVAFSNHQQIMEMIKNEQLQIIKGRAICIKRAENEQIEVVLSNNKVISANLVLNAMGFDFGCKNNVLINCLLEEKIIAKHPTNLGFEVLKNVDNFYLTGSLLTGQLLEITAVPELRIMANEIASKIN